MHRRELLSAAASAAGLALASPLRAAPPAPRMQAWLERWMRAFNAEDLAIYAAFVRAHAPSVTPYLDDDLSVREVTGGFELLSVETAADTEITALVRDRAWDRRSRLTLRATDDVQLEDIVFAAAPAGEPQTRLQEREAVDRAAGRLDQQGRAGRFSGSVLVARDTAILLRAAHGVADEATGVANTPATRFCIGSMGKMFTAVAVMQAVERGQLSLDAPLRAYLPDYPNAAIADRVTVRHLLTHTGGTGDIFGPDFDGLEGGLSDAAGLIALYGARDPVFEPGARWGYSNYGFILLGRLVEVATGRPYAAVVEDQILRPAGMTRTSLGFAHEGPTARSYTGARATGLRALSPYVGLPAGGAYSTVDDLHAFAGALRAGRLVRPDTLAQMTAPHVAAGASHWGLGFAIRTRNGQRYYGHAGSAPGVSGELALFPTYTTAVLSNRGHPSALCAADFVGARLPA